MSLNRPRIRLSQQIEVTDDVQDFVARELVGKRRSVLTIFSSSIRMQLLSFHRRPARLL